MHGASTSRRVDVVGSRAPLLPTTASHPFWVQSICSTVSVGAPSGALVDRPSPQTAPPTGGGRGELFPSSLSRCEVARDKESDESLHDVRGLRGSGESSDSDGLRNAVRRSARAARRRARVAGASGSAAPVRRKWRKAIASSLARDRAALNSEMKSDWTAREGMGGAEGTEAQRH